MVRIFIADDNEPVRKGLRYLMESHGDWAVVGEAANGTDAVQQVTRLHPDVAILDFMMPGMNGLEAGRSISASAPGTHVLLCTIDLTQELSQQAERAGVHGAVPKTDARSMVQGVEALLRDEFFFQQRRAEQD